MATPATREVYLFHAGDAPGEDDFARSIADRIRPFCSPRLINVDELERMDEAGAPRPKLHDGVPVFVLSPTMLRQPLYRQKLVTGTPSRNLPERAAFYICHGVTTDEIREQYPDMQQLLLDVMVGEEAELPALVDELKAFIEGTPEQLSLWLRVWLLAKFAAANVVCVVGFIGHLAYFGAFLTAPWLSWALVSAGRQPSWEAAAACHVLYAAGYCVNRLRPLDLWPWLGPVWRITDRRPGGHPDSSSTFSSVLLALGPWRQTAEAARVMKFFALCLLALPGAAALARSGAPWAGGVALFVGLLMPRLWTGALRSVARLAYWTTGMSDKEMERMARSYSYLGLETVTEAEYRQGARRGEQTAHRPWLRKPPRAFISYGRRDEARTPAAAVLRQTLERMGVPCFLDTGQIKGRFVSWRVRLIDPLLDCTHLFVVLGPRVSEAQVMHREIRTALQRWYTELEPAVICVVEPEVAAALESEGVSPELKYLLHDAPKLTYAEAADAEVVSHLLRQRRRQGLWRDWLSLLRPRARLRQFLRNEI